MRSRLLLMNGVWLGVLVAASTWVEAEERESVRALSLSAITERLRTPAPMYSLDVLSKIAEKRGETEEEVRTGLLALLDTLEAQRRAETDAWDALTGLGDKEADPKQVDKFLRELVKRMRKALQGTKNYDLAQLVQQAAGKAGIASYQARDLVLKAADLGLTGQSESVPRLPDKVGILVGARAATRWRSRAFRVC